MGRRCGSRSRPARRSAASRPPAWSPINHLPTSSSGLVDRRSATTATTGSSRSAAASRRSRPPARSRNLRWASHQTRRDRVRPDSAIWVPQPPDQPARARRHRRVSSPGIAPPATGRSIGASTVSGTVRVRLPGLAGVRHARTRASRCPVGTIVDTRAGTVQLSATSGGVAYAANFFEGQFQLAQKKEGGIDGRPEAVRRQLQGLPEGAARAAKKKSVRHLWGDGSRQVPDRRPLQLGTSEARSG